VAVLSAKSPLTTTQPPPARLFQQVDLRLIYHATTHEAFGFFGALRESKGSIPILCAVCDDSVFSVEKSNFSVLSNQFPTRLN
jgi:hypothetical protein